jgi:uncharacterized protein
VRPVAVFDTNVLLSGLVWRGNPYRCLELARARTIEGVTCVEILNELTDKLQVKLTFTLEQAVDTLVDLLTFLRVVPIAGQVRAVAADPDDDKVLECAVAAGATHVVTGDRKHLLPLVTYQGISILSPTDFLSAVSAK